MSHRKGPSGSRLYEKRQILRSISALARKLGHTPSILEFAAHSEISRYSLFQLFPKWNKAVRAAGFQPNSLYVRPEDGDLLKDWGETVRKKRAIPSPWAYQLAGKYFPLTLAKRFGGWDSVPQAFRKFAKGKPGWVDVLEFLPAPMPKQECGRTRKVAPCPNLPGKTHRAAFKDRPTYGNPIPLPEFRHEPVNEQGVASLWNVSERFGVHD